MTWDSVFSEVRVEGLETLDYLDNLQQGKRFTEQPDAITFDGEVVLSLSLWIHNQYIDNFSEHLTIWDGFFDRLIVFIPEHRVT